MFDSCISASDMCERFYCMHSDKHARSETDCECCECREPIKAGTEHYLYVPACEDDVDDADEHKLCEDDVGGYMLVEEPTEYHMCRACQAIWDTLGDGTYVFGDLDEYLEDSNDICIHYDGSDYDAEEEWTDLSGRNDTSKVALAAKGMTGEAKIVAAMRLLLDYLTDEQFDQVLGMVMAPTHKDDQ